MPTRSIISAGCCSTAAARTTIRVRPRAGCNAAANKGQYQAQAVLGRMLFKGENNLPRQPARGLMWLAVAQANAGTADAWIGELYESALKQASSDERAIAAEMLARWVSTKRE